MDPTAAADSAQSGDAPSRALIEGFLELEEIEPNLYRADHRNLWRPPNARGVFGGQVVGQSLVAATKTVPVEFNVHSLHSYFLLAGNPNLPIIYHVLRIRDGRTFATRTVKASQNGRYIFVCTASFQIPESSPYKYQVNMPAAADPESLVSKKDIFRRWLREENMPDNIRADLTMRVNDPSPIEIRFCEEPEFSEMQSPVKRDPYSTLWMRSSGVLDDEQRLHQCVLAYATDHQLLFMATRPLGLTTFSKPERLNMVVSLDHTVWFHAPFRADEWLLYEMDCDKLESNRAFVTGRVFTRDGRLVASVAQEGVVRAGKADDARPNSSSHPSKL